MGQKYSSIAGDILFPHPRQVSPAILFPHPLQVSPAILFPHPLQVSPAILLPLQVPAHTTWLFYLRRYFLVSPAILLEDLVAPPPGIEPGLIDINSDALPKHHACG